RQRPCLLLLLVPYYVRCLARFRLPIPSPRGEVGLGFCRTIKRLSSAQGNYQITSSANHFAFSVIVPPTNFGCLRSAICAPATRCRTEFLCLLPPPPATSRRCRGAT